MRMTNVCPDCGDNLKEVGKAYWCRRCKIHVKGSAIQESDDPSKPVNQKGPMVHYWTSENTVSCGVSPKDILCTIDVKKVTCKHCLNSETFEESQFGGDNLCCLGAVASAHEIRSVIYCPVCGTKWFRDEREGDDGVMYYWWWEGPGPRPDD